ncbi:MAG: hypothetical protein U1F29_14500 [Planctomycetota bacterium]
MAHSGLSLVRLAIALALFGLGACSTPRIDLVGWRERTSHERPAAARGELAADLATVDRLRDQDELVRARELALALAAEHPDDPRVLVAASRAESDGVFLQPESDKDARNHAAASSLDLAERAAKLGANSAADRAQLAWALGTTTHLQPMSARSDHARKTLEVARSVLETEPANATALATIATVHLRLSTLPWIARVFATNLPDASLAEAEAFARRAVEARPSRESRLLLAKVLIAAEREDDARAVLDEALAAPPRFARDHVLEASAKALRDAHAKR